MAQNTWIVNWNSICSDLSPDSSANSLDSDLGLMTLWTRTRTWPNHNKISIIKHFCSSFRHPHGSECLNSGARLKPKFLGLRIGLMTIWTYTCTPWTRDSDSIPFGPGIPCRRIWTQPTANSDSAWTHESGLAPTLTKSQQSIHNQTFLLILLISTWLRMPELLIGIAFVQTWVQTRSQVPWIQNWTRSWPFRLRVTPDDLDSDSIPFGFQTHMPPDLDSTPC